MTDRRLILLGVFGTITILMVGAMIRDGQQPVPEGITGAVIALLGAALAYAYGKGD